MATTKKLKPKPRAASAPAKKRRPPAVSARGKKQARAGARKKLPLIAATVIFCSGIFMGCFALNKVYLAYLDTQAMAKVEQNGMERELAEQKKHPAPLKKPQTPTSKNQPPKPKTVVAEPNKTSDITPSITAKSPIPSTIPSTPIINNNHNQNSTNSHAAFTNRGTPSSYTPAANSTIVAIVIDDIGYQHGEGERTLKLPGKLTVAVIPFTPFAKTLASAANQKNKEVMLHAPMQPKNLPRWGEGLKDTMSENQLRSRFIDMINDIPNLVGINNHMGSGLTENGKIMSWLMSELPARQLYFVDSRTSPDSQAFNAAQKQGVPSYSRDVFLDHSRNVKDISRQLDILINTAKKQGMALGIGHPYPETLSVLEKRLPEFKAAGIEFVTVSELLNARRNRVQLAANHAKNNAVN